MTAVIKISVALTSISPIAFSLAKVGDVVEIKKKVPRVNEFRGEKIGPGTTSFLVLKGLTKIGMLPEKFVKEQGNNFKKRSCRIKTMDLNLKLIEVEI